MKRKLWLLPAVLAAGLCVGCSEPARGGTMRLLGNVEPAIAFNAAKDVAGQYFTIDSVDPDGMIIKCRSKVTMERERLLGGSPTRQVARIHLFPSEGQMAAEVSVQIQRQEYTVRHAIQGNDNYSSVPDRTPAEMDAPATTEQKETWEPAGYATETERRILSDLVAALHREPMPAAGAATAPATKP